MRDRISRAIADSGFGPLCETPPGGAPTGDPAPGAPAPAAGAGGGGGTPPAPQDRSDWIPRARFDEVNNKLGELTKADEDRQRADAEKKGEFQKLAETEKAKREQAETRALSIARRASFIGVAAGKVADPEAAFKLASADGMLDDLDVNDDGSPKDPKAVEKIVTDLVARYAFLKADKSTRSFGDDRSGAGAPGTPGFDPSKASGRELLSAGYAALDSGKGR
jgi:hypothetical protein